MTIPLSIRPLSADDKPAWVPMWHAYLDFYETTRDAAQYDLTFARYIDPERTDMLAWIAWSDARAVGLVHVIVHAHGWQAEPVTYLQDLYADPDMRGQGVGRALIEAVYADADAAGRPNVYWMTQMGNATARQLYDRIATPTDFMKYGRTL